MLRHVRAVLVLSLLGGAAGLAGCASNDRNDWAGGDGGLDTGSDADTDMDTDGDLGAPGPCSANPK